MFCNNCGKEISEKALFCTYCGEKTDHSAKTARGKSGMGNSGGNYIIISSVISIIVAVSFLLSACITAEKNNDIFEWFDSAKVVGYLMHWGICMLMIAQSAALIFLLMKKNGTFLHTKFGVAMAAEGVLFKILEIIFDNDNMMRDEFSVVLFRIFGRTYNNAAWVAIIMGVLLIISGTLMQKRTKG